MSSLAAVWFDQGVGGTLPPTVRGSNSYLFKTTSPLYRVPCARDAPHQHVGTRTSTVFASIEENEHNVVEPVLKKRRRHRSGSNHHSSHFAVDHKGVRHDTAGIHKVVSSNKEGHINGENQSSFADAQDADAPEREEGRGSNLEGSASNIDQQQHDEDEADVIISGSLQDYLEARQAKMLEHIHAVSDGGLKNFRAEVLVKLRPQLERIQNLLGVQHDLARSTNTATSNAAQSGPSSVNADVTFAEYDGGIPVSDPGSVGPHGHRSSLSADVETWMQRMRWRAEQRQAHAAQESISDNLVQGRQGDEGREQQGERNDQHEGRHAGVVDGRGGVDSSASRMTSMTSSSSRSKSSKCVARDLRNIENAVDCALRSASEEDCTAFSAGGPAVKGGQICEFIAQVDLEDGQASGTAGGTPDAHEGEAPGGHGRNASSGGRVSMSSMLEIKKRRLRTPPSNFAEDGKQVDEGGENENYNDAVDNPEDSSAQLLEDENESNDNHASADVTGGSINRPESAPESAPSSLPLLAVGNGVCTPKESVLDSLVSPTNKENKTQLLQLSEECATHLRKDTCEAVSRAGDGITACRWTNYPPDPDSWRCNALLDKSHPLPLHASTSEVVARWTEELVDALGQPGKVLDCAVRKLQFEADRELRDGLEAQMHETAGKVRIELQKRLENWYFEEEKKLDREQESYHADLARLRERLRHKKAWVQLALGHEQEEGNVRILEKLAERRREAMRAGELMQEIAQVRENMLPDDIVSLVKQEKARRALRARALAVMRSQRTPERRALAGLQIQHSESTGKVGVAHQMMHNTRAPTNLPTIEDDEEITDEKCGIMHKEEGIVGAEGGAAAVAADHNGEHDNRVPSWVAGPWFRAKVPVESAKGNLIDDKTSAAVHAAKARAKTQQEEIEAYLKWQEATAKAASGEEGDAAAVSAEGAAEDHADADHTSRTADATTQENVEAAHTETHDVEAPTGTAAEGGAESDRKDAHDASEETDNSEILDEKQEQLARAMYAAALEARWRRFLGWKLEFDRNGKCGTSIILRNRDRLDRAEMEAADQERQDPGPVMDCVVNWEAVTSGTPEAAKAAKFCDGVLQYSPKDCNASCKQKRCEAVHQIADPVYAGQSKNVQLCRWGETAPFPPGVSPKLQRRGECKVVEMTKYAKDATWIPVHPPAVHEGEAGSTEEAGSAEGAKLTTEAHAGEAGSTEGAEAQAGGATSALEVHRIRSTKGGKSTTPTDFEDSSAAQEEEKRDPVIFTPTSEKDCQKHEERDSCNADPGCEFHPAKEGDSLTTADVDEEAKADDQPATAAGETNVDEEAKADDQPATAAGETNVDEEAKTDDQPATSTEEQAEASTSGGRTAAGQTPDNPEKTGFNEEARTTNYLNNQVGLGVASSFDAVSAPGCHAKRTCDDRTTETGCTADSFCNWEANEYAPMVCAGKTPETQAICSGLHFSETDCEGDHFCQWIVKPSVAKHCINKTRCVDYDTKAACLYHLNEPNLEGSADNSAQRSCAWTEKLERSKICRSKSVLYPNPACAQQTSEKSCLQGDDCEWLSNPKPEFECQPRAFACHDHKSQTECMTIGDTAPLRSSKTSREDADGDHNKIEDGDHTKNDSGGQNAGGDTVSTSEDNNRNPGSCIWTRPPVPSACVDREHPENASSVCRQYTSAASCRKQNLKENQVVDQMKGNASCVWSQLPSLQRQNACYTKKEVGDYEKCQSHYLQHLRKENQDLKDEPKLQVDEAKIVPDEAAEHLVNPSACTQEKGVCHFVPNPATHVCIGDSVKDDVHCMQFDAQKESCRADGLCIWWKVTTDEKGSEIMKARTKAKIQLQNTNRMRRETEKLFLGVKDARARGMEFVASGVENSTDALGAGGVNKQGLTDGAQKLVPKNDDAATTALQGFKNMLSGGGISSSALELHPTIKTSAGGSSSSYNNDNIMTNTTRGATTRNVHHSSSRGATTTMFADTSTSEGADVGENGANLNEDGAEQGASSASSSADVQDTVTGEAVVEDASIILHPAEVEAPLPHQEHSPTAVRPGGRCLLVNPELMREADKDGAGLDAPCNTRRVRRSQQQDTAEQAKEVVDQAPDGAAEGSEVPRSTEGATEEIDPPLTREGCEDGSDGLVSSSHGGHFSTPPGGAVVPGSSNCRWFRAIPTDKGNGVELLKAWVSEEVVRFRTSQKARIKSIFETNALSGELYPASDGTERHLKATAREWLAEAASVTDDMVTQVANKLRKRIDYFVDAKNEVEGAAGTVFTRQQLFREVQDDVARELFHAERMAQQRVTEVQRAMEEYAHLSFTRLPMESGTSSQRLARRQRRNVVANSRWLDPFVFFTKQQQGSSIGNNKDIRVHPSEDSRTGVSTSMKTASFVEDRGRGRSASFARSQEAQRRHQHVKSLMRKLGTSDLVLYQQKTGSLSGDTSKNAGSSRNNHSGGTKKITTTTLSPAGEWVKKMLFSSEDGQEEDAQHDSQGGDHILSATTSSSSTSFGKKDTKNYMDAASSFAEEGKDQDEGHSEEHSEEREQEENQVEKPPEVEVEPSDFFFTNHVHKPKDIDGSRESRWNLAFPHIMKLIGKRNLGIENTTVTLDDETADATSMMIRSIESKVAEVNESINGPKIATPDLAVLHPALKSLIPNLPVPGSESDMRLRDYVGAILKTVTSEETWSPMKEFVSNAFGVAKDAGGVVADVGSDVGEVAADVRKVAGDVGNKVAGDVGKVAGDVGIAAAGAAVDTARVTANVASPMTMLAADFLTLYKDFHRTAGNALKENLSEMPTFWEIQNREPRKMRSDSRILSEMQRLAYSRMRNMSLDNAVSGTSYDDAERPVGPAMSALHQAFFLKFGQTTPGYEGHTLSEMKTDKKLRKVCINHGLSGVKTKCALPVHGEGQKIARLPIPASVLPESWSPLEQREHAVKCARSHGCAPGCMGCQDRVFDAGTAKYLGEVNPYRPADAFQHRDNPGSNSFVSSSIDREKAYEEFLAVEGERIRQGMEASLVPRINMDDTTADFAPDTVLAVA